MKILKKIVSVFLAVVMLAPAYTYADLKNADCGNEAGLLMALGILSEEDNRAFSAEQKISRKDFARMVVKAACVPESGEPVEFTDFTAEGALAAAVGSGIISGYSDGSFRPGAAITLAEAVKLAIGASGLEIIMSNREYPSAYMKAASDRKLLDGVSKKTNGGISVQDAVELIYNMLNTEIPTLSGVGEISFEKGNTLLSEKFGLTHASGIVTGNEYTRLSNTTGTKKGYVEINNTEYLAGNSGAEAFLGYKADYYYDKDESEIIYICYSKKTSGIILYSSEIEEFENNVYRYCGDDESGQIKKAKTDENADVIYNGRAQIGVSDKSMYIPEYGRVVLADNDDDGVYDVIFIYDISVEVLHMYNEEENAVLGKYTNGKKYLVDPESGSVIIKDKYGKELDIKELKEWDVLEIIQSTDGDYTEITVLRDSFSGSISRLGNNQDGKKCIAVNGKEYVIEKNLKKYMEDNGLSFQIGNGYTYYQNQDGEISGYKDDGVSEKGGYGYLIKAVEDEVTEALIIKILDTDGEIRMYTSAEKLRLDGIKNDAKEQLQSLAPIMPGVVYYETNKEGNINLIDSVEKTTYESEDSLHIKGRSNNQDYNSGQSRMGGAITFKKDSVVFVVPASGGNNDDYSVRKPSDIFVHYNPYTITGYSRDKKSPFTDVAVYTGAVTDNIATKADVLLVQSIDETLNEDDEITCELTVITPDGEKKYVTKDADVAKNAVFFSGAGSASVEKGDVIRIASDMNGNVTTIQLIYSPVRDKLYLAANPTNSRFTYPFSDYDNISNYYVDTSNFNAICRIEMANVFYKTEGYIRTVNPIFDLSVPSNVSKIKNGEITMNNYKADKIYKYDSKGKAPYRACDISEIYDYGTTKSASKVLIRSNDAVTKLIVVY